MHLIKQRTLNTVKKHISLILLLIVFFIPTVVKIHHILEGHDCVAVCSSKDQKEVTDSEDEECEICSFQFAPFTEYSSTYISFIYFEDVDTYDNIYTSFKYSFVNLLSLRGPPSLA